MCDRWREEAISFCWAKGLNRLSNREKSELCIKGFNELSKINLNADDAKQTLRILRNKEVGK